MKVILTKDVINLGEEGDVLEVKPGYARNYLIPNGLVALYNRTNLAVLESRRKQIEKKKEERRLAAQGDKARIDALAVTFNMPAGENGRLFGAVTSQMVVEELAKHDISVERKRIEIPGNTIKATGDYKLRIRLYKDAAAELRVKVVGFADAAAAAAAPAEAASGDDSAEAHVEAAQAEQSADSAASEEASEDEIQA